MPSIRLIARQAFTHQGRAYRPDDHFETTPIEAAALTYQGKADFLPPAAAADAAAKGKGRYRRRDLRADE